MYSRVMNRRVRSAWLCLFLGVVVCGGAGRGAIASDEELLATVKVEDLEGQSVSPLRPASGKKVGSDDSKGKESKAHVFVFLAVECPISNRYAPELRRLHEEFKGARFALVYPNGDESAEQIRKSLKEYNLPMEAYRDSRHELVKAAGVRVTPEAAVFVPGQGWVYRGRIDDRFAGFGKERVRPTKRDLRDVLTAVVAGKKVEVRRTEAIGCAIP